MKEKSTWWTRARRTFQVDFGFSNITVLGSRSRDWALTVNPLPTLRQIRKKNHQGDRKPGHCDLSSDVIESSQRTRSSKKLMNMLNMKNIVIEPRVVSGLLFTAVSRNLTLIFTPTTSGS